MAKPFPVIGVIIITDYMNLQLLVNTMKLRIIKKNVQTENNLLKSQLILQGKTISVIVI